MVGAVAHDHELAAGAVVRDGRRERGTDRLGAAVGQLRARGPVRREGEEPLRQRDVRAGVVAHTGRQLHLSALAQLTTERGDRGVEQGPHRQTFPLARASSAVAA